MSADIEDFIEITFLNDEPHAIEIDGQMGRCLFTEFDEVLMQDQSGTGQVGRSTSALISATRFPNDVAGGAIVQIDGQPYKVWRSDKVQDGKMILLVLDKA